MHDNLGGTPALPGGYDPTAFLPEMVAAPTRVSQNSDLNAQDPNIPKVAMRMPSFLPDRIRNPEAVARGEMPAARQEPVAQPTAPQPEPYIPPAHHRSDFPYTPAAEQPMTQIPSSFQSPAPADHFGSKVPKPEPGRVANSIKVPANPVQHPVLASLMSALRNTAEDTRSVSVDGFVFKMRPLPADLYAYAMNIAQRASSSQPEMAMRFNMLRAVLALTHVNDEPIYLMLNEPIKGYPSFEDWAPPVSLVIKYAPRLIDLFFVQLKFKIVEAIAEEYDKFDLEDSNMDALMPNDKTSDLSNEKLWRFKCSVPGCNHVVDQEPQFMDASGESIAPIFCPHHGEVLTPIGRLVDLSNVPLA
jgi:hypothetical protein